MTVDDVAHTEPVLIVKIMLPNPQWNEIIEYLRCETISDRPIDRVRTSRQPSRFSDCWS
jgi:hypothetical protein